MSPDEFVLYTHINVIAIVSTLRRLLIVRSQGRVVNFRTGSKVSTLFERKLFLKQDFIIELWPTGCARITSIYGSEFWTMYNWVQTWGKIKISEVLRATYLA